MSVVDLFLVRRPGISQVHTILLAERAEAQNSFGLSSQAVGH